MLPARTEARLDDACVQPFDRRPFLRVRADVEHLRDIPFIEALHPQRWGDPRTDLRPPAHELLLHLLVGRVVGHDDHQRPPPCAAVAGEDRVEVRGAFGVPPESLERPYLPDQAAPLQRGAQPVRDRV
jgi:hypothetical protein